MPCSSQVTHQLIGTFDIFPMQEIFVAVVMAFLLVISTSLWLYNLLELRKEVEDEIVNVITTLGSELCKDCVEFLPNYAVLFAAVVSC